MKTLIFVFLLILTASISSQWTVQTTITGTLYSISAVNNDVAWACGPTANIVRTTNGGQNWSAINTVPVNVPLYNIFAIDANSALVTGTGDFSYVWKTTNGGVNWVQVLSQEFGFLNGIHINTNGTGFLTGDPVGGRWSLWKTTNYGSSWDSTGMRLPAINFEFGFQNALHVNGSNYYFGSNDSRIYVSTNSGTSWTARTTTIKNPFAIWFNGTVGIAGGTSVTTPGVNRSTNSGTSWVSVTVPTTNPAGGLVGDGTWFWIARGSTIYRSTDNGVTWAANSSDNVLGWVNHMCKSRTGNMLWAVTSSGEICSSEGVLTGLSSTSGLLPENYSLSQNYPNPFNPVTNIEFSVPKSLFVKLTVSDVTGREIVTLVNQNMTAGTYKTDWDASKYSSGIYFYTITSGSYRETKKMMLVK